MRPKNELDKALRREKYALTSHLLKPIMRKKKKKKKRLFCKLLQVKCTYFCADLRMEENKKILNRNENKWQYEDQVQEGWNSKLLGVVCI